jgi:cyclase
VNSAAIARPEVIEEIAGTFGAQCVVVAMDVKRSANGFEVYSHGGRRPTGIDALAWATEAERLGAGELLLTSMDRDGTASGYDLELLRAIGDLTSVPIVASGGVGTLEHLREGALAGADALLAASIFHYGTFTIAEAKAYLEHAGVELRPIGA